MLDALEGMETTASALVDAYLHPMWDYLGEAILLGAVVIGVGVLLPCYLLMALIALGARWHHRRRPDA